VRELENAVERAVILLTGDHISEKELPLTISQASASAEDHPPPPSAASEPRPLEEVEKEAILAALAAVGGNKSEAARRLGITRKTLHQKLKRYGVT
jgi:two-component system response regulator HydG